MSHENILARPVRIVLWKIYCVSVLEQSCVEWGSSLTQENIEDLKRTQKTFAKLVLRDKYVNYELALQRLNLETQAERRKKIGLGFVKVALKTTNSINFSNKEI